jgi:hypothetical protein
MKIIGRDVTVYQWELFGYDVPGGLDTPGAVANILGRWETIEVNMEKEWVDNRSADAFQPEQRRTIQKWDASCKGYQDNGGSEAIEAFLNCDFLVVTFTDVVSNRNMVLRGGIKKSSGTWGSDNAKDTLDLMDVGREPFGGFSTLVYL